MGRWMGLASAVRQPTTQDARATAAVASRHGRSCGAALRSASPKPPLGYGRPHTDVRSGVIDVAFGIPQRRVFLRLGGCRRVPGADEDLVLAGREVNRQ